MITPEREEENESKMTADSDNEETSKENRDCEINTNGKNRHEETIEAVVKAYSEDEQVDDHSDSDASTNSDDNNQGKNQHASYEETIEAVVKAYSDEQVDDNLDSDASTNSDDNNKGKNQHASYGETIEAVVQAYSDEQVAAKHSDSDASTNSDESDGDDNKQNVAVPNPNEADLPSDASNRDDYKTPEDKSTTKQYEYFNKPQTKFISAQKSGQLKPKHLKFNKNIKEASKLSNIGDPKKHKINPKYHLLELQRQRLEIGTWVQCTICDKWRYLATITDPQDVHSNWKCSMNPNSNFSSCEANEILPPALEEQDMIYSPFSVGSLVWVHQPGYPWWPAMVDDDPDTEQFYWLNDYSDIPTHYNVVFFDSETVSRAWIPAQSIVPFSDKAKNKMLTEPNINNARLRIRLAKAKKDAMRASTFSLENRLQEFSFVARFKGKLHIFKDEKKPKNKNKHSLIDSRELYGPKKPYPKKATKLQSESDFTSSGESSDSSSSDTSEESTVTSTLQRSTASSSSSSSPSFPKPPKKTTTKKMVKIVKKKDKSAPQCKKMHKKQEEVTYKNLKVQQSQQGDIDEETSNDNATNDNTPHEKHVTSKKTPNDQHDKEAQNNQHATKGQTDKQPEQKMKSPIIKTTKKMKIASATINIKEMAFKKRDAAKQGKKEKAGKSKETNENSHLGTLQKDMVSSKIPKASKISAQAKKPFLNVKNSVAAETKKGDKPRPVWKKENFEKKITNKKFSAPIIKKDIDKIKTVSSTLQKDNKSEFETKVPIGKKRKLAAQFKAPIIKKVHDDTSHTTVQPIKLENKCEITPCVASPKVLETNNNPVGVDTDTQPSTAAALDTEMLSLAPLEDADLNFQPNSPLFDMEED